MGIQNLSRTVLVRDQKLVGARTVLLCVGVTFCTFITGCTDEAGQHCNMGISLWKKDEYDKAISEFGKALEMNPQYAKAYYYRANAYYDSGQYGRAWADVHTAEDLGYRVTPRFIEVLQKASGRER